MPAGTTNFPGALDSHTGGDPFGFAQVNNLAQTLTTASHTNSVTTITVASTTAFESRGYIKIKREIISYTGKTGTTFTGCTRAADGTSAAAYLSGTVVEQVVVAANHNAHSAAIVAVENVVLGQHGQNAFLDPAMNIWVDGATFSSIADGTWGPAGLIYRKSGAAVHDLLRSTDVPAVAANVPLANYSCQLDVTTADGSIAAGDYALIATRIEGYNWVLFAQRSFSFGFWVKAAKTGTHCVFARNSGNDRSCVMEYSITAADTWEYKTVTFPASPSAGTWDYTNGRGIEIGWTQYAGSTFQTTAGAWQTGNFYATSSQVNEVDSTSNNFRLALLGPITAGAYAAPFSALPIALEDLRCRRYNEVLGGVANSLYGSGPCESTTKADCAVSIIAKRATSPTITVGTVGNLSLLTAAGPVALTGLANLAASAKEIFLQATTAGFLVAGENAMLYAGGTEQLKIVSRIP